MPSRRNIRLVQPMLGMLPEKYLEDTLRYRMTLVEMMLEKGMDESLECELVRRSLLLSPIVATCGPAGPNAAPFMVSYLVKEEYLEEALEKMRDISKKYWGKPYQAISSAARFLLDYVYKEDKVDPSRMVSHVMSKGHTWINIASTGKATLAFMVPPDKAAYEVRTRASIVESGSIYEYTNMLHDLMHAVPHGERSHPWYPAILFEVEEIYDNSYKVLGKRIYPSAS